MTIQNTKLQHRLGKSLTLTQTDSNGCQIAFLQHNVQLLYSGQLAQMRCSVRSYIPGPGRINLVPSFGRRFVWFWRSSLKSG